MATLQDLIAADQSRVNRENANSASGQISSFLQALSRGQRQNQAHEATAMAIAKERAGLQRAGFPVERNKGIGGFLRTLATGSPNNVAYDQYENPLSQMNSAGNWQPDSYDPTSGKMTFKNNVPKPVYQYDPQTGQLVQAGSVPKNAKVVSKKRSGMSPSLQKYKDDRTEEIITLAGLNKAKKPLVDDAMQAIKNIKLKGGVPGFLQRTSMKLFDPNNPLLGEWQKIKMVLTDAQLLNTANTKGAISDREMALFADAAANDDLTSLPRIIPVLNKINRLVGAEFEGKVKSYKRIYDEDPMEWDEIKGMGQGFGDGSGGEDPLGLF